MDYNINIQSPNEETDASFLKTSLREFLETKSKENSCGIIASSLNFEDGRIEFQKSTYGNKNNIVELLIAILFNELSNEPKCDRYNLLLDVQRVLSEEIDKLDTTLND